MDIASETAEPTSISQDMLTDPYLTPPNVRMAAYLQGAHGVIKSLLSDNIYYYQDSLGSTTHISNGAGQLLETYRYDLYGKPVCYTPNNPTPAAASVYGTVDLYAGERWVGELGLYDLRNRFMSPEMGRFMQADPIGFKGDASNLYRYSHNDPANFSDPMGLYDPIERDRRWDVARWFDASNGVQGGYSDKGPGQPAGVERTRPLAGKDEGPKFYRGMPMKEFIKLTQQVEGGDPMDTRPLIDPIDIASGGIAAAARSAVKSVAAKEALVYLYQKVGAVGEHLKFGITKNPAARYTAEELAGGKLKIIAEGTKREMLKLERSLHETLPIGREEGQKFYIQKQIDSGLRPPPYGD